MFKYKSMLLNRPSFRAGFTLMEILLVLALIGILAAIVIVALNPSKQMAQTRNSGRATDVKTISYAISQYEIDHNGQLPPGIDGTLHTLGTATSGCAVTCNTTVGLSSQSFPSSLADALGTALQPFSPLFAQTPTAHAAGATGWISPTGDQEPGGQWNQPALAYDGNIGTYAVNTYAGTGWGQYIVFTLTNPIVSDRVRINTDYLDAQVSQVEVDVFVDGAWVTAFVGGSEATWNDKWVTITFPKGTVTQARFRYNYAVGGFYYWMYEFQFYQGAAAITPPSCATTPATSIQSTSAVLQGSVIDDGGEPVQYRFQYGPTTSYDTNTAWGGSAATGEVLSAPVSGLASYTTYHYRAQVQNSAGSASCNDVAFTTNPPGQGWVAPSGGSDPTGQWMNMPAVGDGDTTTYASAYHAINATQWSSYLYFSYPNTLANSLRFYARGGNEVSQVDIDIFTNGSWVMLYQGAFADQQWVTEAFSQQTVSQIRVRFYAQNANNGFFWQLFEFGIQKLADVGTDACLDLTPQLVPTYLPSIPADPSLGSAGNTYYAVRNEGNNRISVYACGAELGQTFRATR